MIHIPIKLLNDNAKMPEYANAGDAGADLFSTEGVSLPSGRRKLVKTGIAIELPYGYVGLIHPRSGLANKYGLSVVNAPGTIDSGYRGEIMVNLINLGDELVVLRAGTAIAQLVIQQVEQAAFIKNEKLKDSDRGENGHGSTGM